MALVYIYSPREEGERRTHWTRTDFSAQSKSLNKRRNSSTYSSKAADKQPVKKCKMTTQM